MKGANGREIIGYCIYCKNSIQKGTKYVVNEDEDMLHKECDRLIEDNADYFGR
jgi:hypothetical protein